MCVVLFIAVALRRLSMKTNYGEVIFVVDLSRLLLPRRDMR